ILWFLALDNALVNSDGYWTRASDYTLFADAKGMFHVIPHDMNEAFSSGHGGPGGPRRDGRGGGPFGSPIAAFDDDGDGRVQRGEFERVVGGFAGRVALAADGTFGPDEFAAALQATLPPPGFGPPPGPESPPSPPPGNGLPPADAAPPERRPGDGDRRRDEGRRGGGPGRMFAGPLFAAVDPEKRGRLGREEFIANAWAVARAADSDGDESLDEKEVVAAMQKLVPPPGGGRGPGGGGPTLDPLVGLDDPTKPLRAKLLAVPVLRDRYLDHVKAIAREQLDWSSVGRDVARWRALIIDAVREDTRKLQTTEAFEEATSPEPPRDGRSNLRGFLEKRRAYLLDYAPKGPAADRPPAS
ncbi:MAG: hypothetical protein ACR2IT_02350, partial [Pirellulales bacterium]